MIYIFIHTFLTSSGKKWRKMDNLTYFSKQIYDLCRNIKTSLKVFVETKKERRWRLDMWWRKLFPLECKILCVFCSSLCIFIFTEITYNTRRLTNTFKVLYKNWQNTHKTSHFDVKEFLPPPALSLWNFLFDQNIISIIIHHYSSANRYAFEINRYFPCFPSLSILNRSNLVWKRAVGKFKASYWL